MAATAGRVNCGRCGANNFNTQAACWKCGAPLSTSSPPPVGAPLPRSVQPVSAPQGTPYSAVAVNQPDPAVAIWAAIALAILFPYIAVPVGIIFFMLDDRRKAEIGRVTLIWGIVSSIVQILFTMWLINATVQQGMGVVQGLVRSRASATAEPDGNTSVPGLQMPGVRPASGSIPTPPPTDNVPFPEVPNSVAGPK